MIPIKADLNSVYKVDNNPNNDDSNNGYVIINKNKDGTSPNWSAVRGLEGSNKNPNRYIISVTSLTNNDYIIGDPRERSNTSFEGLNSDNNNKTLQNYYATEEGERTQKMISPQFMVASSYGVCSSTMSYSDAEKRCAAYQEDGYPAGRWRVPTEAEVKYIIQLSSWEVIPVLFNKGTSYYWSAHGGINVNTNNVITTGGKSNSYVRCVYDTWYWGTDQLEDRTLFTYGDEEQL